MANEYAPEVWKAIHDIWSVSPKNVGWRIILENVKELLNCDVPSISVCARRCDKEMWKKNIKKVVKKGVKTTSKNIEILNKVLTSENPKKTMTSDEILSVEITRLKGGENNSENTIETGVACIDRIVSQSESNTEKLVSQMRQQAANGFVMNSRFQTALSDLFDDFCDTDWSKAEEAQRLAFASRKAFIESVMYTLETASKSSERYIKMIAILHGLDPDDFKDRAQEQAKRSAQMDKMDDRLIEIKRQMALDKEKVFMRDVAAMEVGEYTEEEEKVLAEIAAEEEISEEDQLENRNGDTDD